MWGYPKIYKKEITISLQTLGWEGGKVEGLILDPQARSLIALLVIALLRPFWLVLQRTKVRKGWCCSTRLVNHPW